jgi:hypothetical protein
MLEIGMANHPNSRHSGGARSENNWQRTLNFKLQSFRSRQYRLATTRLIPEQKSSGNEITGP